MLGRYTPLLASLVLLTACHHRVPDRGDLKGVPPPAKELTWESFFRARWPDPLHEKYEELFGKPFPNPSSRHFSTGRPFSDTKKYELEFDATAVPGARAETESAAGAHAVSLELPDSADKAVAVKADDKGIRLTVSSPQAARRYRVYRSEELLLPLPDGADPATARVVRDGDWVRIKFHDRKPD